MIEQVKENVKSLLASGKIVGFLGLRNDDGVVTPFLFKRGGTGFSFLWGIWIPLEPLAIPWPSWPFILYRIPMTIACMESSFGGVTNGR